MLKCMGGHRTILICLACVIATAARATPPNAGTPTVVVEPAQARPPVRVIIENLRCGPPSDVIFFETGQSVILPVTYPVLDEAARMLRSQPDIQRVRIEGHADRTERNGLALSRRRAASVMAYLIQQGVARSVLVPVALGSRCPRRPSYTADNRAGNQVVFIVVLQQDGKTLDAPRCRDAKSEEGLVFNPR